MLLVGLPEPVGARLEEMLEAGHVGPLVDGDADLRLALGHSGTLLAERRFDHARPASAYKAPEIPLPRTLQDDASHHLGPTLP